MSAVYPLFCDVRLRAMREKRVIVETVMRADDSTAKIRFGPRGGWRIVK